MQANRSTPSADPSLDERRTATLAAAIRSMVRDFYQDQFGHRAPDGVFEGTLHFKADPAKGWDVVFEETLIEQLLPQLEGYEATKHAFQLGHVYCYQCHSAQCEHSYPANTMEVFAGYHSLGTPQWLEYSQFLLALRDERVDQLYADRPKVLAKVVEGEVLKNQQLASFGKSSKTFEVLGQVTAGYFVLERDRPGMKKVAVSIQVVEVRNEKGSPHLELNPILSGPDPQPLRESLDLGFPWIGQGCRALRQQLNKLNRTRSGGSGRSKPPWAIAEDVRGMLERLAKDLERGERKSQRQTQHAKIRETMERPIHKAMADLRNARPEQMYRDLKTKAIMVCGSKGRCHAFNETGNHITSFVIHTEAIQIRLRKKRWAMLHPDQSSQFLAVFQKPSL